LRIFDENLHTHFIFGKLFLSFFRKQQYGVYINLNGDSSEIIAPKAGIISIIGAAERRLTEVFASEITQEQIRVYSLELFTPIITRNFSQTPLPHWLTADQVGEYILKLYNGKVPNAHKPIHKIHGVNDLS